MVPTSQISSTILRSLTWLLFVPMQHNVWHKIWSLSSGQKWNIGMPLPAGGPLRYKPTGKIVRVGSGQLADPVATWVSDLPRGGIGPKAATEDIVQRVAVKVGATHAWIRSVVHNYGYEYDKFGNRIPVYNENGAFTGWKFVRKDNHITVAFGTSETHVVVHGHIYVTADATGTPTGLMDMGSRKYVCDGDGRVLELWKQVESRHEHGPEEGARPQHTTGDSRHGQTSYGRPRWQEEFLMDHYCPWNIFTEGVSLEYARIEEQLCISDGNVSFLLYLVTMTFCANNSWPLPEDIAVQLSGVYTLSHIGDKWPGWGYPNAINEKVTEPTYLTPWNSLRRP
ncbi:uncharacterized protein PG986_011833 [Apiospora aurea]|uniref:Uncharacterized protein n=1 Tax=Apiospora aurea TaxID=335848 RepID=A0ABR1PYA6_9PEZI